MQRQVKAMRDSCEEHKILIMTDVDGAITAPIEEDVLTAGTV